MQGQFNQAFLRFLGKSTDGMHSGISVMLHQFLFERVVLFIHGGGSEMKKEYQPFLWTLLGAAYGLMARVLFAVKSPSRFFDTEIISIAFMLGTPIAIGAIVVYGLRHSRPTIAKMMSAPWLAVGLAMLGSAITLLEGSVCIVMASPIFFMASSIGGLTMGLILRWTNKGKTTLNTFFMLPMLLTIVEPAAPRSPQLLEDRVSIEVAASPHRIWQEIKNARHIRKEELPKNLTHWIGVPRPIEGVNVMTPRGEVRYSKWERGVNFSALVTREVQDRSITWRYTFTPDSFPKGSLDDHVKIGSKYFDLYDTTFNLVPIANNMTRLEIISHYSVTTNVNFYGVPVARFIAKDFMSTIVQLYKFRSERSTQAASKGIAAV